MGATVEEDSSDNGDGVEDEKEDSGDDEESGDSAEARAIKELTVPN